MRDSEAYKLYQKNYQLNRYYQRRQQAIEYLGSYCAVCKSFNDLEIDHIDYSTKSFNISKSWNVSSEKFWNEIKKCQLLCKPCHINKSKAEDKIRRPITHGKYWAAYKHKCTCTDCLEYRKIFSSRPRKKSK